ncbi:NepR family anti-sigma factor [Pseudaestuariivita rosea]|uniref:NepR family anti-sigma factor n=1 Tax=Pseudaestuariivita rosea TaxID=2763263 RepID=UPI001ABAF006|nr:NepR family anti-sigma factor [Pseudaestuariivita rosea]
MLRMTEEKRIKQSEDIDENLKRAFCSALDTDMPERFKYLLDRLKKCELHSNPVHDKDDT